MPHKVLAGAHEVDVAVGNDKEVVGHGRDGLVVVVGNDDAVVPGPLPPQGHRAVPIFP